MAENTTFVAKMVGSIIVDFSKTLQSISALEKKVESLDTQLKKLQATTSDTAKALERAFNIQIKGIKVDADNIRKQISKATKDAGRDIQDTLLRLERGYTTLLAKGEQLGVLPKMAEANLAQVRMLQQQVALGKELTKNDLDRLKTLEKRLARANYELDIVKQETAYYDKLRKVTREIGTPESRMFTALSRSILEAPATIQQLQAKLLDMQRNITRYGLESIPEAVKIATLQSELANLEKQFVIKKQITKSDVEQYQEALKRLNLTQAEIANLERVLTLKTKEKQLELEQARQAAIAQRQLEIEQRRALGPESFLERRFGWFVAGAGFFGGIEALRQTVNTIREVEMGMVQISRVSNEVAGNFTMMRDKLLQLAYQYGMTWQEVQDIALRWAQAGYNIADTLKLTEASLLALNTAELDARYATEGLIGIMAQWGLTASQLPDIIDKINKVADDYAVTSQDLIDGLLRSSGAAKIMGLSLEETIAILTVMREATGRTGKEVGNALNSILSFIQRPKALETFAKEGIAVFTDETMTKFRSVKDILADIAAKWDTMSEASKDLFVQAAEEAGLYSEEMAELIGLQEQWNDLQRRDIAQAAAGVYRRNYLVALLQNWAKVDQVLLTMETARGYSMRENARTMETLEKKIAQLKAALTELAVAVGDSGFLDFLKSTVELGRDAIQVFNSLPAPIRTVIFQLTTAITLLKMVELSRSLVDRAVLRQTGIGINVAEATTAAATMTAVSKSIADTGAKAVEAATKVSLLSKTMGGLALAGNLLLGFLGGWKGILIIGILSVIPSIISSIRQYRDALQEQAGAAANVARELELLEKVYGDNIESTERYKQLVQEVADNLPYLIDRYDEHGKAISFNRDALLELAKASKEYAAQKLDENYQQSINTLIRERNYLESQRKILPELIAQRNRLTNALEEGNLTEEQAQKVKRDLAELNAHLVEVTRALGIENLNEAQSVAEATNIINNSIDKKIETINATIKGYYNLRIQAKQAALEEVNSRLQALKGWEDYYKGLGSLMSYFFGLAKIAGWIFPPVKQWLNHWVQVQYNEEVAELQSRKRALEEEIRDLQGELSSLMVTSSSLTSRSPGYVGYPEEPKKAKESVERAKEWIELFREGLEKAVPPGSLVQFYNLNEALENTKNYIEELAKWEEALKDKIEAGNISRENFARLTWIVNERIRALTVEQQRLEAVNSSLNEQYSYYLRMLDVANQKYEEAKASGNVELMYQAADAIKEVKDKLAELSREMSSNNREWYDIFVQISKARQELNAFVYETLSSKIDQAVRRHQVTLEDQIKLYRQLAGLRQWDARQTEELYNKMADVYSELLRRRFDEVEEAYQEHLDTLEEQFNQTEESIRKQMEEIDRQADKQIKQLQEQLKALDEEDTLRQREKAREEHEKRIQELLEQRRYHELRTGLEHQKAIQEIDKQIAEENQRWAEQQAEWEKEDRRKQIQEQIDHIREQADIQKQGLQEQLDQARESYEQQRKEIEKHYKEMKKTVTSEMLDILASMAASNEQWFTIGKQLADAFVEGFKSGNWQEYNAILENIKSGIETYQDTGTSEVEEDLNEGKSPWLTIYPGEYQWYDGRAIMLARALEAKSGIPVGWDENTFQVIVEGKRINPVKLENGRAWVRVRDFFEAAGRDVRYDENTQQIYIYHNGGWVRQTGLAYLEAGEYVIPRATVQKFAVSSTANIGLDRILVAALKEALSSFNIGRNTTVGTLLNVEHMELHDDVDAEILSREVMYAWKQFNLSRG